MSQIQICMIRNRLPTKTRNQNPIPFHLRLPFFEGLLLYKARVLQKGFIDLWRLVPDSTHLRIVEIAIRPIT